MAHQHIILHAPRALVTLTERAGQIILGFGGKELYVSDSRGQVHLYVGPDWQHMSDDEISKWLADHPLQP